MIQVGDFVFLKVGKSDVPHNSVGIIEELTDRGLFKVFFIGKRIKLVLNENVLGFLDIAKTGKPYKNKICNVCHILKEDFVDFEINQTDAKGQKTTRPTCRTCRVSIDGIKLLNTERKRMLENKPEKFFICPICQKGSIPNVTANLVIDHNHETGMARAWICDSCNTGLGRFKDDIELLNSAINYLKKHP